jgi:hypothetical protein
MLKSSALIPSLEGHEEFDWVRSRCEKNDIILESGKVGDGFTL